MKTCISEILDLKLSVKALGFQISSFSRCGRPASNGSGDLDLQPDTSPHPQRGRSVLFGSGSVGSDPQLDEPDQFFSETRPRFSDGFSERVRDKLDRSAWSEEASEKRFELFCFIAFIQ